MKQNDDSSTKLCRTQQRKKNRYRTNRETTEEKKQPTSAINKWYNVLYPIHKRICTILNGVEEANEKEIGRTRELQKKTIKKNYTQE